MYEYCADKHWSLDWMEENQIATYFLLSRLITYDIMKNRILATFDIKKMNFDSLYAFNIYDIKNMKLLS